MNSRHADLEAISAYVDGEAPEWADHVAACASCRATAASLRAVSSAIGRPVDAPSAADRERAIAAALDAVAPASANHQAERARFARRRSSRPWAMPAVAAVVVGLLGASGLVLSSYRTPEETTTVAGPAPQTDAKADALLESGGGVAAAAPSAPPVDLGDLPDAATLRARAQVAAPSAARSGDLAPAVSTGRSASSANSGAASSAGATVTDSAAGGAGGSAQVQTPTTTLSQRVAPSVVGTRPCEEQARTREPALGPVVFFATARQGSRAGYVLGFGAAGSASTPPVTLLLLAQEGCAELLRSAGP